MTSTNPRSRDAPGDVVVRDDGAYLEAAAAAGAGLDVDLERPGEQGGPRYVRGDGEEQSRANAAEMLGRDELRDELVRLFSRHLGGGSGDSGT